MRIRRVVIWSVLVASGCFEEGGEDAQRQAAEATADGILAFPDLTNNVTTDAVAAGDALAKFLKTPIAADALLSPPFQLGSSVEVAKRITARPADLPGCVATTGEPGCDSLAASQCVAGSFTFDGGGSRTCEGCPDEPDVLGTCSYSWSMTVGFADPEVGTLEATTTGFVTRDVDSITGEMTFGPFKLTDPADNTIVEGSIKVCACQKLTVSEGPPRRLVDSQFVVKDLVGPLSRGRCALVTFNGDGIASSELKCSCPDNATCAE